MNEELPGDGRQMSTPKITPVAQSTGVTPAGPTAPPRRPADMAPIDQASYVDRLIDTTVFNDVNRIRAMMMARRQPLGFWRTVLAVWLATVLAGITLALLAFLVGATVLASAWDDVKNDATTISTDDPGTYDFPTDIPTDIPTDLPGEVTP